MPGLKIAVMVHNLRLGYEAGLKAVVDMGVTGIHLSVGVKGFRPEDLDSAGRKAVVSNLKSMGLEISAISAWGGGVDLGEPEGLEAHIEQGKRLLELAVDLECGIWQGHCGVMPHVRDDPKWGTFADSFGQICRHGEKVGACLAVETGPEPPAVFLDMIGDVGSSALKVNYDPANLILWPARYMQLAGEPYSREKGFAEYQPMEGVRVLGPHIVHTHAKDAMVTEGGKRQEVPLGDGWIDWPYYVGLLREQGFEGYFAVEREVGEDPVGDITRAAEFLKTL